MTSIGDGNLIRLTQVPLALDRKPMSIGSERIEGKALERLEIADKAQRLTTPRLDLLHTARTGKELAEVRVPHGQVQADVADAVADLAVGITNAARRVPLSA